MAGNFGLEFSRLDLEMVSKTCHLLTRNLISSGRIPENIRPVRPYCWIILIRMIYNKYKIEFCE
jgi:hypothetical protein